MSYAGLPSSVRERLDLAVLDLLGVALCGMRTPEVSALVASADQRWPRPVTPPPRSPASGSSVQSRVAMSWRPVSVAPCGATRNGTPTATGACSARHGLPAVSVAATWRSASPRSGAAGSLMRVTPWQVVLDGDVTRNLWMADAVPAGLRAAQLAAAGLARAVGRIPRALVGG